MSLIVLYIVWFAITNPVKIKRNFQNVQIPCEALGASLTVLMEIVGAIVLRRPRQDVRAATRAAAKRKTPTPCKPPKHPLSDLEFHRPQLA